MVYLLLSIGEGETRLDGKMINPRRELAKLDLSSVVRPDASAAGKASKTVCSVKDDRLLTTYFSWYHYNWNYCLVFCPVVVGSSHTKSLF